MPLCHLLLVLSAQAATTIPKIPVEAFRTVASPDGSLVFALNERSGPSAFIDAHTGDVRGFVQLPDNLQDVLFSPSGHYLATWAGVEIAGVVDLVADKWIPTARPSAGWVDKPMVLAFSPDESQIAALLVTPSGKVEVDLWSTSKKHPPRILPLTLPEVSCAEPPQLAWTTDNAVVGLFPCEGAAMAFDVGTGQPTATLPPTPQSRPASTEDPPAAGPEAPPLPYTVLEEGDSMTGWSISSGTLTWTWDTGDTDPDPRAWGASVTRDFTWEPRKNTLVPNLHDGSSPPPAGSFSAEAPSPGPGPHRVLVEGEPLDSSGKPTPTWTLEDASTHAVLAPVAMGRERTYGSFWSADGRWLLVQADKKWIIFDGLSGEHVAEVQSREPDFATLPGGLLAFSQRQRVILMRPSGKDSFTLYCIWDGTAPHVLVVGLEGPVQGPVHGDATALAALRVRPEKSLLTPMTPYGATTLPVGVQDPLIPAASEE